MISPIIRGIRRVDSGFTLLELLLVITLLALLTSVALPRLNTIFSQSTRREGAAVLVAQIKYARVQALKSSLKIRLEFSTDATSYRIQIQDRKSQYHESFKEVGDGFLDRWHDFPKGIRVKRILSQTGSSGPVSIVFGPDGSSEVTEILLEDRDQKTLSVYLGPHATDVRLEPYDLAPALSGPTP